MTSLNHRRPLSQSTAAATDDESKSSAFTSLLRSLDLYGSVPRDLLAEQTVSGALTSCLCVTVIAYLLVTEFINYLSPDIQTSIAVERPFPSQYTSSTSQPSHTHHHMYINLDITLPAIPCAVLQLQAQDYLGKEASTFGSSLNRQRLTSDGQAVQTNLLGRDDDLSLQKGEGCRLSGHLVVRRVPGVLFIAAHAHPLLFDVFNPLNNLNMSHVIHSFTFAHRQSGQRWFTHLPQSKHFNTLSGTKRITQWSEDDNNLPRSFNYHLSVVPTTVSTNRAQTELTYNYVSNHHEIVGRLRIPAIFFRYDIDGLTLRIDKEYKSLASLFVSLSAIIGGVYVVLQLFSRIFNIAEKEVARAKTPRTLRNIEN